MVDPFEGLERLEADTYLTVDDRLTYFSIMRRFNAQLMMDLSAQRAADELG